VRGVATTSTRGAVETRFPLFVVVFHALITVMRMLRKPKTRLRLQNCISQIHNCRLHNVWRAVCHQKQNKIEGNKHTIVFISIYSWLFLITQCQRELPAVFLPFVFCLPFFKKKFSFWQKQKHARLTWLP